MDAYDSVFEILTAAVNGLGKRGVSRTELLPALLDFSAAVALAVGGEEALEASAQRLADRLEDWRNGTFPGTANSADLIKFASRTHRKSTVKRKSLVRQMTAYEITFKLLASMIDTLRFEVGIPQSEILRVLTDATTAVAFEMKQRAGVDAAVQMIRERTKLVEDTHRLMDADAGKLTQ